MIPLRRVVLLGVLAVVTTCATPAGTRLLLQLAAGADGGRLQIGRLQGSLLGGAVLSKVRLAGLRGWPSEMTLRIGELSLAGPLDWRRRPLLHATEAAVTAGAGQETVRADDVAWRVGSGVELRGLLIREPALMAPLLSFHSQGGMSVTIHSGLLQLPHSAPIWFSLQSHGGVIDASARGRHLAVEDLAGLVRQTREPPAWSGTLTELTLRAQGRLEALEMEGAFQLALETPFGRVTGCAGLAAVTVGRIKGAWSGSGTVGCEGGAVTAERAGAQLCTAALEWAGGAHPVRYDVVLEELQVDGGYQLPADVAVSLQRVRVQGSWPDRLLPDVNVFNGRLWLPRSEPLFFSGGLIGGRWDVPFYISTLNLRDLWAMIHAGKRLSLWRGRVKEFDGTIQGRALSPQVSGQFHLETISGQLLTVAGAPGTLTLEVSRGAPVQPLQLRGEIEANHGAVQLRHTTVALLPSRMVFSGDPKAPRLDAQGLTTVAGTRIHVVTQGLLKKPDIQLTSDPPMAHERLLMMLATGKAWRPAGADVEEGWLSPELATDAIDFFVFGGEGGRLASQLGISETSLEFNPEQNRIGASATFAERIELRVEADTGLQEDETVNRANSATQPVPERAYKVGAAYKLTPDTSVGVERGKEPLVQRGTTVTGSPTNPESDETIFFKLKRRF